MAKVCIDNFDRNYVHIECPGCKESHMLDVRRWTFNGDIDRPTFTPSLLVRTGHFVDGVIKDCWCDFEERFGYKPGFNCQRCHSFITDGKIQFLSDSTHDLAGRTVELPSAKPLREPIREK